MSQVEHDLILSLHASHRSRLLRYFSRKLLRRDEAADMTQETFLRLLKRARGEAIENPQAYLFQVARSVVQRNNDQLRRQSEVFDVGALAPDVADDLPGQERIVHSRQALKRMAQEICRLPNRCQQVFILSRLHGMTNAEIAQELGISRNMVEKHIIRALLQCRTLLEALDG
ncbi:MAG: sigma-70 family RNA polymerase sigma factor [Pseudomonadota bacterium]|uniref:RNA polymerase sigma factor n=1 Tax=Thalassovita sp. TaxID=1979401 RepID=UPI002AB256E2|nr:sigma-70 family RNA polymerase sigma factor [Thalassovita sp.]MEC8293918.1 sigma-70 family RNA polymerase sigma factor [Pseudomonadota bacterium]